MSLSIQDLHVSIEDKKIIHGLTLTVPKGEVHAIMGPNGSGKSTLANTLMGHPNYTVSSGEIVVDGNTITDSAPDERAKAGLFLSMQYPPEIAGVTISNFLRVSKEALIGEKIPPIDFYRSLQAKMKDLNIDPAFAKRYVNQGFSGGEKKRAEILQLSVLQPTYAILDETDSGLDVDALKIVAEGINTFKGKDTGVLLITHYNRILEYITPDKVHIMVGGKIVHSGGHELALKVEKEGYDQFIT
jgi:Fe-S cluster assembly ATP-binding protein